LNARESEIADLKITIFVDEDIAGFEIAMHDACRVDVFQSSLVKLA
jgi:hypothetical protein